MCVRVYSGVYEIVLDNTYSWATAKTVTLSYFVGQPLSKSQKKNMKRRAKEKERKRKGVACAACGYKLASSTAQMCPQCGSRDKVLL